MDASADASGATRPVTLVTVKRLWIKPHAGPGEDKYGHWWFEIGDALDESSESYGWYPMKRPVGTIETLSGVGGCLNGAEAHSGRDFRNPPPRDPHHGDYAQESAGVTFHPLVAASDHRTDAEIADCLRRFSQNYSGEWRWTAGWGQNCRTFQQAALAHCGLLEPDESDYNQA